MDHFDRLRDRNFINGVVWIAKTGARWRGLPERFGPWTTVYNRFLRWAKKDRWHDIFRERCISDDDIAAIFDGSVVRAHQDAAGERGGPPGQQHDSTAEELMDCVHGEAVLADKAYDSDRIIAELTQRYSACHPTEPACHPTEQVQKNETSL